MSNVNVAISQSSVFINTLKRIYIEFRYLGQMFNLHNFLLSLLILCNGRLVERKNNSQIIQVTRNKCMNPCWYDISKNIKNIEGGMHSYSPLKDFKALLLSYHCFFFCQAQPQLQLNLWLRLVLFLE